MNDDPRKEPVQGTPSRVEEFLAAVEAKTTNATHLRLLRACRNGDAAGSMEAELRTIVEEILDANQ